MKRKLTFIAVAILAMAIDGPLQAANVWIDTDPACGHSSTSDVDDCWALFQSLRSPQLNIKGISTVFGNAEGEVTYHKAREVITTLVGDNKNIPVFRGSDVKLDRKSVEANEATSALISQLEQETTTLVALGPVTNIAELILLRPDLVNRISEVLVVAGRREQSESRFYPGSSRIYHMHDFNFRQDVESFEVLLESSIALTLLPYELASQVIITAENLQAAALSPATKWLAQASRQWLSFWRNNLLADGFHPFDSMAILYLTKPESIRCELLSARIVRKPSMFVGSRDDLLVSKDFEGHRMVNYCFGLDTNDLPFVYKGS